MHKLISRYGLCESDVEQSQTRQGNVCFGYDRLNAINKVASLSWSLMGEQCLRCPGRMEIISCSDELPGSI